MGKVPDTFDEFKWPFKEGELEEETAAKLIYNARKAEEKALETAKSKDAEIATLKTELDTEKARVSGADTDKQKEIADLQKQIRDLSAGQDKPRPQDEKRLWQLEVALDLGLSAADSKRLQGETRDEIETDAKTFAAEHGIDLETEDDGRDSRSTEKPGGNKPVPAGELRIGNRRDTSVKLEDPAAFLKDL